MRILQLILIYSRDWHIILLRRLRDHRINAIHLQLQIILILIKNAWILIEIRYVLRIHSSNTRLLKISYFFGDGWNVFPCLFTIKKYIYMIYIKREGILLWDSGEHLLSFYVFRSCTFDYICHWMYIRSDVTKDVVSF